MKKCKSARELMPLLEYNKWQNFHNVINMAKEACKLSNHNVSNQFTEASKLTITFSCLKQYGSIKYKYD